MAAPFQAKGELRVARVEIDGLREDKAALDQALDAKSKEVRMQLLQVYTAATHGSFCKVWARVCSSAIRWNQHHTRRLLRSSMLGTRKSVDLVQDAR